MKKTYAIKEIVDLRFYDGKTGEEVMRWEWEPTIGAFTDVCEKNEEDKEDEKLG